MELKASWYDNLIAGGLFWLPQMYWVFRFIPDVFPKLGNLTKFIMDLSDPVAALIITAIVALATLVILVTGNILEILMGSGLAYWEIDVFHRHFAINKHWVQKALKKHALYTQSDYDSLDNIFKHARVIPTSEPPPVLSSSFWDRLTVIWEWAVSGIKDTGIALSTFNRLYALMLVRTLSKSGDEQSEIIVGPLQALRLARLLGITFLIFLVDGLLIVISELSRPGTTSYALLGGFIIIFIFEIIALKFIANSFDRVCLILFPLWYDVELKEDDDSELAENSKSDGDGVVENNNRKKRKQTRKKVGKNSSRRA